MQGMSGKQEESSELSKIAAQYMDVIERKRRPTGKISQQQNQSPNKPVESKTRTYHGRVGSERPAERPGEVGQDWVPTELIAQETKVYHSLQGIEKTSLQRLSRSTNMRNPM